MNRMIVYIRAGSLSGLGLAGRFLMPKSASLAFGA